MQIATNRSWLAGSGIAAALVIVLAPAVAQTPDAAAPPPFLQEVLKDLVPSPRTAPPLVAPGPAKSINDAIAALNAKQYAEARAALAEVRRNPLSPYELGIVEVTLFHIAYGEEKLAEARQHLLNAIETGGLSAEEVAATQRNIERIDARLAADPLTT
jgi:hypothetical protein